MIPFPIFFRSLSAPSTCLLHILGLTVCCHSLFLTLDTHLSFFDFDTFFKVSLILLIYPSFVAFVGTSVLQHSFVCYTWCISSPAS